MDRGDCSSTTPYIQRCSVWLGGQIPWTSLQQVLENKSSICGCYFCLDTLSFTGQGSVLVPRWILCWYYWYVFVNMWLLCSLSTIQLQSLTFITESSYNVVCQVTTLFTFGVSQPLFFIILLFMIRSKTKYVLLRGCCVVLFLTTSFAVRPTTLIYITNIPTVQ